MSSFAIGAASSFVAGSVILILTHLDDFHYLFTSSRKYKHLEGHWHQYHLTNDSRHVPHLFWAAHHEELRVTRFGRIRGNSHGGHAPNLEYRIGGNIRQNVMRLRYKNRTASELPVSVAYPHLLSNEVLVGVWVGHDYDEHMSAGPIVLSRNPQSADLLAAIAQAEQLLNIPVRGRRAPVVDPPPAPE